MCPWLQVRGLRFVRSEFRVSADFELMPAFEYIQEGRARDKKNHGANGSN